MGFINSRTCYCPHCIEALESHGERLGVRPMDDEDLDFDEDEEFIICDWCGEEYPMPEMRIVSFE